MATYMVGTPGKKTGLYLLMALSTCWVTKRGSRIMLRPSMTQKCMTVTMPYAWNSGMTPMIDVFAADDADLRAQALICMVLASTFR